MQEVVPVKGEQRVMLPAEVVRSNVQAIIAQEPDIISFDPTTDEGELISLRIATDAGVSASIKDGYRGTLVHWGIAPFDGRPEANGEVPLVMSLALIFESGDLVRLFGDVGWKEFLRLVKAAGKERLQLGLKVKIKRRPSGTAGHSYWTVLPDA